MMRRPSCYGCAVEFAVTELGGKWKTVILARLKQRPHRYGELRKTIPAMSDKMLTQRLEDLVELGLIGTETVGDHRVYRLTEAGERLRPVLTALYEWGQARAAEVGATIDG